MALSSEERRENFLSLIVKAAEGDARLTSNIHPHDEEFANVLDALPCPYPPEPLVRLYERSSALRPCVEAMTVNVHGFGVQIKPKIDLTAADVNRQVSDILLSRRIQNGEEDPPDPTDAEVEEELRRIERGARVEKLRLEAFLKNCAKEGLVALRMKVSTDYEVTGNGYVEVVRDAAGRIARLNYCPSVNMRLRPLESKPVRMWERRWVSAIDFELEEIEDLPPRGFIQRVNAKTTWFKGFGDPRVMSAETGTVYPDRESLPAGEREATEVIHLAVHNLRTSYGVPRWIGAVFEVLGIEAQSQVNYLGFDNKCMPPLAISVSGGTLTDDSVAYLENFIKARIKGRGNYYAPLILEAIPTGDVNGASGPQTRIAIQPIAQPQDAVFLEYADRAEDVVARQWRISPITRGKTKDYNRATSDAAMKKDEEQVFHPERGSYDERFERTILLDLGVRYHRVESNSPVASDPEAMTKILDVLMKHSLLDVNEGRKIASKIMNDDFREREEDWGKQPPQLTLAGIPVQDVQVGDAGRKQLADVATTLQRVLTLREQVRSAGTLAAGQAEAKARADEAGVVDELDQELDGQPVRVVRVTPETMRQLVKPHGAANSADAEAA